MNIQTNTHPRSFLDRRIIAPPIAITRSVLCRIMSSIGARPAETGGILLGPISGTDITDYYFDVTAECSGGTYSPDASTLKMKMKCEWLPSGLDMKGFVHSHPDGCRCPSAGDMIYIGRLLTINPDMSHFVAPIVLPPAYTILPFIVAREDPNRPQRTYFRFIEPEKPFTTPKGVKE